MDLNFQTGAIAAEPRCPVHGKMHLDFPADTWTCRGFDGEGCEHRVRTEDLDWLPLSGPGVIRGLQWMA